MAEVSDDFLASLKTVRGEFQNTKGGRIGNRVLAHVFSTLFPIVFVTYLVFVTGLSWPLPNEAWLFIGFAIVTLVVGVILHGIINSSYVFDDEGVQEIRGNGQLKQRVRWADLTKVEFRESRGIRTFTLKTADTSMQVEFYRSLVEAIAEVEERSG